MKSRKNKNNNYDDANDDDDDDNDMNDDDDDDDSTCNLLSRWSFSAIISLSMAHTILKNRTRSIDIL